MATTDENGIVFYDENDLFSPVHTALNLLSASISDRVGALDDQSRVADTAITIPVTNTNNFTLYGAGDHPIQALRVGSQVYVGGVVQCLTPGYISAGGFRAFGNVPLGYRPAPMMTYPKAICQGTGDNRWWLTVFLGGTLSASRYGPSDNTGDNTYMPFYISYPTTDPWPGG